MGDFYAHSVEGLPASEWEPMSAHLRLVASGCDGSSGAEAFAAAFGAEACGRLLSLWHDLGKYSVASQE